jgi:hypothetical protein
MVLVLEFKVAELAVHPAGARPQEGLNGLKLRENMSHE